MNLGDLVTDARLALRDAARYLVDGSGPVDTADLLTALTARSAAYAGLARVVRSVAGHAVRVERAGRSARQATALAEGLLRERGQHANKLYAVLIAAADSGGYPPTTLTRSTATERLVRAADLIGAAGDLLAGHVPPDGPPRTREGAAIREGGAARAGLAEAAAVMLELVRIDAHLPGWLAARDQAGSVFADRFAAALRAPGWTTTVGLAELADELAARAAGAPDLGLLQSASAGFGDPPADSRDPLVRLAAFQQWLDLHPELVDAQHLRAGTRLGLATALLTDPAAAAGWRAASVAAMSLNSPPTSGPARHVAAEVADLTTVLRDRLPATAPAPQAASMAGRLPVLAGSLRGGLVAGVARGALLVAQSELSARPIRLIYRYQTTARPATARDPAVANLNRALAGCADTPAARTAVEGSRSTALAFPHPPRPGSGVAPAATASPARPVPGRTRHR